uniref:c-Myc-binding protein n=1 Tax=Hemiselmis andersenii TaxID=464988 RepID=A0A7S1E740_HEMAN|mmetsp:Transcript_35717/g.86985  ORF Transcript_35717/g.86985 Transcript_35717/m.86985 type:complete len:142 (+) Transcript_35717:68-493(+)
MSGENKKEEFRKYLERSGVIDALTKVLVALYEEPEKPANALDFIKQYLGAPTSGDVETMRAEKDELVKKNEEMTKQLEVPCPPAEAQPLGGGGFLRAVRVKCLSTLVCCTPDGAFEAVRGGTCAHALACRLGRRLQRSLRG